MWKRNKNTKNELLAAGQTDRGRIRKNNEDFFLIEEIKSNFAHLLCVVADGMGGQDYGEIASQAVVTTFHKALDNVGRNQDVITWLSDTGKKASDSVKNQFKLLNAANGMGSTLVGGLFLADRCYLCNVGDSRAYLFRQGRLERITKDHSLVEILVDKGLIGPDEVYTHPRRGELTRYVGQPDDLEVDICELITQPDDIILFCSDGLWEMVRDHAIACELANNQDPAIAVARLVKLANQNGGTDNITAILVRINEAGGGM